MRRKSVAVKISKKITVELSAIPINIYRVAIASVLASYALSVLSTFCYPYTEYMQLIRTSTGESIREMPYTGSPQICVRAELGRLPRVDTALC